MSNLMYDLEYVRTYINDLLVITNGDWTDHLNSLESVLKRLQEAGLKLMKKIVLWQDCLGILRILDHSRRYPTPTKESYSDT